MSELSKLAAKKEFPETLEKCGGIITSACQILNISRESYRQWCIADPEFKAQCESAISSGIDLRLDRAEQALNRNIDDGKESSIFYLLNNLGQHRGYGKRPDSQPVDVKIDLSTLTDAQLNVLIEKQKVNS